MHVDYPERRRLLFAAILTLVALPALWLMSRDEGSGAPNVATAGIAVAAGKGRYGMVLWVRPKDYARAARTLRASV